MKLPKNSKQQGVAIEDLYAVKIGAIWKGLKQEHISFWALCAYFLFEYIRPQSIYTAIDVVPWSQIAIMMALVGALTDRRSSGFLM